MSWLTRYSGAYGTRFFVAFNEGPLVTWSARDRRPWRFVLHRERSALLFIAKVRSAACGGTRLLNILPARPPSISPPERSRRHAANCPRNLEGHETHHARR